MGLLTVTERFQPIRSIEWVVVVVSIFQGVYVFSPLYRHSLATHGVTPFVAALSGPTLLYVFMGLLALSAIVLGIGLVANNPRLRAHGLFFQGLLRFYNVFTTILFVGFLPVTWIYALTVSIICLVLWAYEAREVKRASP